MWLFTILLTSGLYIIAVHSSSCTDNRSSCKSWKRQGYCRGSTYTAFVKENCRLSCNLCRRGKFLATPCVDYNDDCPDKARRGLCGRKLIMKMDCRLSCKLCTKGPTDKWPSQKKKRPVNGKYGEWSRWGSCSKSCGRGQSWRTRRCDKPAPQNNGKQCVGPAKEGQDCMVNNYCPIDGQYGDWSGWTKCTKDCGRGRRLRLRKCNNPAPKYQGKQCVGPATEAGFCNEHSCPVVSKYGEWSSWTKCTQLCGGGMKMRMRKCDKPPSKYNGKDCVGPATVIESCNEHNCPIDGKYGEWSRWTPCSKICGGGRKFRERECNKPAPKYNGKKCVGSPADAQSCNEHNCPNSKFPVNFPNCGKRFQTGRVVGGSTAKYGDWPWQVGIVPSWNERFVLCGGTLINSRTVLTAAHCFKEAQPRAESFSVRVGDVNLDVIEDGEIVVKVTKIIRHQGFVRRTYVNDIAVMILEKDVTDDTFVGAACIAVNGDEPVVNETCSVTGWGRISEYGSLATILQEAEVPIVSSVTCSASYSGITSGMLCAGYPEGLIDSCEGDSGGPLVCKSNGKFVLQGIVSFGTGCARKGFYGVYTKVSAYEQWIRKALN